MAETNSKVARSFWVRDRITKGEGGREYVRRMIGWGRDGSNWSWGVRVGGMKTGERQEEMTEWIKFLLHQSAASA